MNPNNLEYNAKLNAWLPPRRTWPPMNRPVLVTLLIVAFVFSAMGAATQINIANQVKGILAVANGGTGTSSTLSGIMRGGSPMTAAEFSGDVTTSGSNAATVARVNGTSVPTNAAADTVLLTTASATGAWAALSNCPAGALQYTTSTHTFACGSVLTGSFADDEVPTGTINGSNVTFTLAHTPSPALSLSCFKNGQKLEPAGADFTLATATITAATAPATGDVLTCNYRY